MHLSHAQYLCATTGIHIYGYIHIYRQYDIYIYIGSTCVRPPIFIHIHLCIYIYIYAHASADLSIRLYMRAYSCPDLSIRLCIRAYSLPNHSLGRKQEGEGLEKKLLEGKGAGEGRGRGEGGGGEGRHRYTDAHTHTYTNTHKYKHVRVSTGARTDRAVSGLFPKSQHPYRLNRSVTTTEPCAMEHRAFRVRTVGLASLVRASNDETDRQTDRQTHRHTQEARVGREKHPHVAKSSLFNLRNTDDTYKET
jgi:hypothetical protein